MSTPPSSTKRGQASRPMTIQTRRRVIEAVFQSGGIAAIAISLGFLVLMFAVIGWRGAGAFTQTHIALPVHFDAAVIDPAGERDAQALHTANYRRLIRQALSARFPEVNGRQDLRRLYRLISSGAPYALRDLVVSDPGLIGQTKTIRLTASDDVDMLIKGQLTVEGNAGSRNFGEQEKAWVEALEERGEIERRFNAGFFTSGDSREPEQAGILGAATGSFLTLIVCFLLSFPLGVLSAVYLEEFARKGRLSHIIEVNINNLAAVPSIIFGLLGLAILLNVFHLPRSTPLVGGMVLALMTLPTIIIASRAALKTVPPSVREAAAGLGASKVQTTFHHVVPLAMPGMLTGAIVGMAQALGETAPLLMIGMVAFIVDIPGGFVDAATALPVQIFLWADSPERAFLERTSAAIIVLVGFLMVMNLTAVVLRNRLEYRW